VFTLANRKSGLKGFTLVELLVVIAIISVLATLLLLQLGVARSKARDAKRIADINQVRSALEQYFDQTGFYLNITDMSALAPIYLLNIPKDPLAAGCTAVYDNSGSGAAKCYGYAFATLGVTSATPTQFQIWAQLEQPNKNALQSSAHLNSTGWGGATVNASSLVIPAVCTAAGTDCVFDLGQR
jgi:prepilin-type N-terminal cleavage/methylation domain-containing protein